MVRKCSGDEPNRRSVVYVNQRLVRSSSQLAAGRRTRDDLRVAPAGEQAVSTDPAQRLLALQRTAGNRAVSELIARRLSLPGAERRGEATSITTMVQRAKVSDDHVADDLRHPQASRLFTDKTMEWWVSLERPQKSTSVKAWATAQVEAHRDEISYEQLSNTTLKSGQGVRKWFGQKSNEYMYVHVGNTIYIANRDLEKHPHPTLVGGDPDATCAGTMRYDQKHRTIRITNESGHFRPKSVPGSTVDLVVKALPGKSGKGQAAWKVEKNEL